MKRIVELRFRVAPEVADLLATSESNAQGGFHEIGVSSARRANTFLRIHLLRASPGRNAPAETDREGTARPERDGRATNRQLPCAHRYTRRQTETGRLPEQPTS